MTLSRSIAEHIAKGGIETAPLLNALEKYRLLTLLPHITKELEAIERRRKEESYVHIETPFPLATSSLQHIKGIIKTDAEEKVTINENLLAGFKAKYKGTLYDGSVETIIRKFTNH